MNQSVNRLVQKGHSLADIKGYTLSQFLMFVDAVKQIEAEQRLNFVTDMSVVIGSLFSKDNPVREHNGLLLDQIAGAKNGDQG